MMQCTTLSQLSASTATGAPYVNANECIECKYRSMVCIFIDSGVTNTETYTDHATTLYVPIGRICATYAMRQGAYLPDRFFRGTRRRF